MDVGAALVAGAEPLEGVQPGKAALDHPALAAEAEAVGDAAAGNPRGDAARAQLPAVGVEVVAAVGEQLPRSPNSSRGRRRGRPRRPRIDGTASTSGMSWVMSWRLPPVSVIARGTPPASTIKWCLEPGRPRSTGDGPTASPFEGSDMGAVDRAPV